jgi:hypothetical protein
VGSGEHGVKRVGVRSGECGVGSVVQRVWCGECEECGECGVWSVECGVESVV